MDDIGLIVFSTTFEDYIERLSLVFDRIRASQLKLKESKTLLFKAKLKFLGFFISQKGLEVNPEQVRAVKEYGPLKNAADVRSVFDLFCPVSE